MKVTETEWPADERIEFSNNQEELYEWRNCCALVSVRYLSGETTVHKASPKYEVINARVGTINNSFTSYYKQIIEFISYVGGLISLWLGFSVFAFYDLFERIFCMPKRGENGDNTESRLRGTWFTQMRQRYHESWRPRVIALDWYPTTTEHRTIGQFRLHTLQSRYKPLV